MSQPLPNQEWISGRFRGVYASERMRAGEGARRMPLSIQYGELSNVASGAPPVSEEAANELHFAQVRKVKFTPAGGGAETERTLFDVRIRRWQLLYPAESDRMAYGTLVGELSGRLTPPSAEPVERREPERQPSTPRPVAAPAVTSAPIAAATPAPAPAPIEKPMVLPKAPADRTDTGTVEQDIERLLWLVVPALLAIIGLGLSLLCGARTAAIWFVPVVIAIGVRQLPAGYLVQAPTAARLFGGLCALVSLFTLVASLQAERAGACLPALGINVLLLAVPFAASAFVRAPVFVWACATIWTAAMCTWCSALGGACTNLVIPA